MDGQREKTEAAAVLVLVVAIAASLVYLLGVDSHLSFIADDWEALARRPGWSPGTLLAPFNQNLLLGVLLVYKALLAVFGMSSAMPYFVASMTFFALAATLLFIYLRSRVGNWAALILVLPVLFLGGASEDLLWAFQMGFFASIAAGLGMLIALDREDARGDRIASLLLFVSLAFASIGIAFAAAAATKVLLGPRRRRRLLWVALPIAAYGLWWLGWGRDQPSNLSLHNLVHLAGYVFDSAGAGVAVLLGRNAADSGNPGHPPLICQALLVAVAIGIGYRVWRDGRISRDLVVVLVLAFVFWALAGLNRTSGRPPISSRYQYPSAIFLLLIFGEALRGLRIPRPALLVAALVSAAAVYGGITLIDTQKGSWRSEGEYARGELGAVEIGGRQVSADFPLSTADPPLTFGEYRRAARAYGTPAYGEAKLSGEPFGANADSALLAALRVSLGPIVARGAALAPGCRRYDAVALEPRGLRLARGERVTVADLGPRPLRVTLARFEPEAGQAIGGLAPGQGKRLSVPPDSSPRPWLLGIEGRGPIRICPEAPAAAGGQIKP